MTECINRHKRNAKSVGTKGSDPSYRILEQNADTNQRATRPTDPSYRILGWTKTLMLIEEH
jgi:hypothetical protein